MKRVSSPYVVVKQSKIHRKGLFAKKDIPKGARIIEYVGNKITKKQSDAIYDDQLEKSANHSKDGAVYIFELNKRYDIDGKVPWNTARYANHSCTPNAETDIIKGHIYIIATKNIKKGDEVVYNYGYDLDDWQTHPCNCGTKKCVGYIAHEDDWAKLKRRIAAKKARSKKARSKKATKKTKKKSKRSTKR